MLMGLVVVVIRGLFRNMLMRMVFNYLIRPILLVST
jgi:hypothetical protein